MHQLLIALPWLQAKNQHTKIGQIH